MRRWASRLWDAYWDRGVWRDRDRVATVIAYAIFIAAALFTVWVWPVGIVGEVTFWITLFALLGLCVRYDAWRRARRRTSR